MRYFSSPEDPGNLIQLQQRIAVIFVGLTLFAMVFFGISDFLLGMSSFLGIVRVVYVLLFLGCFVLMVRFNRFFLAMNLMLGLVLIFSILNYFYNDGFRGPTIFNLYVFVVAVAILFKRPLNLVWFFLSIGSYLILFYLEAHGQVTVQSNYEGISDLFWDNAVTLFICAVFIFIGIALVITNYQRQNQVLNQLRLENERNLAQLSSLNEKKNHLIALLSHDLKAPVSSLGTTLELVDQGVLDREELDFILKSLKKQSFHLGKVLDNTLTWVMAEMEDKEIQLQQVDLWGLTEDMRDIMQVQASKKNQSLEIVRFGENRKMDLALNEVKIILKNILDNAIKFSPVGAEIRLILRTETGNFRWEVINSGSVIPLESRNTLFDLNVKSTVGTKKELGTGIGLSLCKKIAEKLEMNLGYTVNEKGENVFFLENRPD